MRSEVMYRDLPGGPLLVKFANEVSLWCLCSKCGMFSKDMFQDSSSHVFCSVCIFECSTQKKIHCKHERRDVPVDDMVQAVDVSHVMMDQVVFCPNSKGGNRCAAISALKDLEGHYLKCAATEINCLSCGSVVTGLDWKGHTITCPQQILQCRYCAVAVPRCSLQAHERVCYENPESGCVTKNTMPVDSSKSCSKPSPLEESQEKFNINTAGGNGAPVNETRTFHNAVDFDDHLFQCTYCKRKVKRKNMEHHLTKCAQNKMSSSTSTVRKSPGTVEVAPSPRSISSVGPNYPKLDAPALENSLVSCAQYSVAPAARSVATVGPNYPPLDAPALNNSLVPCAQPSVASAPRSTPALGPNDPTLEARTVESSSKSCNPNTQQSSWAVIEKPTDFPCTEKGTAPPDMGDETGKGEQESSYFQYGAPVVRTLSSASSAITNTVKEILSIAWESISTTTGTPQDSGIDPGVTSRSGAGSGPQSYLPAWPAQPSYGNISEWFNQFDAWLKHNYITSEAEIFPLLLNKMPKSASRAYLNLQDQPNPYTSAKSAILNYLKSKDQRKWSWWIRDRI